MFQILLHLSLTISQQTGKGGYLCWRLGDGQPGVIIWAKRHHRLARSVQGNVWPYRSPRLQEIALLELLELSFVPPKFEILCSGNHHSERSSLKPYVVKGSGIGYSGSGSIHTVPYSIDMHGRVYGYWLRWYMSGAPPTVGAAYWSHLDMLHALYIFPHFHGTTKASSVITFPAYIPNLPIYPVCDCCDMIEQCTQWDPPSLGWIRYCTADMSLHV